MRAQIRIRLGLILSIVVCLPLGWFVLRAWNSYRDLASIASVSASPNPEAARGADLVYFYSPACQLCRHATPAVVRAARENPALRIVYFNVAAADFYEVRDRLNRRFGIPDARAVEIPALFSRRRGFVGSDAILSNLASEVRESLAARKSAQRITQSASTRERAKRRLLPWPVAAAALADSINPCAISTALFLISYLTLAGRTRLQLALTGLLYSLGVFSCYGLAGMGLLRGLYGLSGFGAAPLLLNTFAGTATLFLGSTNLRQYFLLRRRLVRPVDVGLPQAARLATHSVIRTLVKRPILFGAAAFAAGVAVGALELPCTGQIYLPTIVYLAGYPDERSVAVHFLLFYNLIFVAPLVGLFALALMAKSTRSIQDMVRQHLPATRVANAACFFLMAAFFFMHVVR